MRGKPADPNLVAELVRRVGDGERVGSVCKELRVSERQAYRWLSASRENRELHRTVRQVGRQLAAVKKRLGLGK